MAAAEETYLAFVYTVSEGDNGDELEMAGTIPQVVEYMRSTYPGWRSVAPAARGRAET